VQLSVALQPGEIERLISEFCDYARRSTRWVVQSICERAIWTRGSLVVFALHSLEVAAFRLLAFDRLEQRFEVPLPESSRTFALDDFREQGRSVGEVLREDLQ